MDGLGHRSRLLIAGASLGGVERFGYLDGRRVMRTCEREHPSANRWQRRSIFAFTLFWRLAPLAAVACLPALVGGAAWTSALAVAALGVTMWAYIAGVLLAIVGAFGRGLDFFPQRVLFLGCKYAFTRMPPAGQSR